MHSILKPGAVVIATSALLLATGCSGNGDGGEASEGAGAPFAAVIKGLDNPFFQTMRDGINAAAEKGGVEVEVQSAQSITDTSGQGERLAALAQQDFGCYIVNPITGNNLVQGLAAVGAKDVPVVNIDRPVDAEAAKAAGVDIATYIGTDNVEAAELAGQYMVDRVGAGTVAIIGGVSGDETSNDRISGFTNSAGGALNILPVVAADWNRQQALTAATDLMTAHPDLVGIFAANDDMGLGAVRAVRDAGKSAAITVISLDGNTEAIESVASGGLSATVAQYPYAVGQLGVQACEALVAGKEVPTEVKSPVALVTAADAQKALDAFPQPFVEYENPLEAPR